MIPADKIIAEARKWLGVPFHHQGRNQHGIDCIGLLVKVAEGVGAWHEDFISYKRFPGKTTLIPHLAKSVDQVIDRFQEPGDILVFWVMKPEWPQHAGIMTYRGIIHTDASLGRVVEHSLDSNALGKLHSVWQYRSHS